MVPPSVGAKFRQDIRYGTSEWHSMYATARNTIEGFNGYIKDGANEALAVPSRRRLRGRTAQHFLTALLVMSANIRKIRTWLIERQTPNATVMKMNRRKRRRRESLVAYLPDANAPPERTGTEN